MKIDPKNLTAQLHYRAAGNPPGTLPSSAISNCFPGLEFDFRNVWKRLFEGLLMHEADNYVVKAEDPRFEHLEGHRLLRVDGHPLVMTVTGPQMPGTPPDHLINTLNPNGVAFMEWSNSMAEVLRRNAGKTVRCEFTPKVERFPVGLPKKDEQGQEKESLLVVELKMRPFFAQDAATGRQQAVIADALAKPGELTQGLCSPWQNDYRECACYYWAASRPDYVSIEPSAQGTSVGFNWLQKDRTPGTPREYILDDRQDTRLVTYFELFQEWERLLKFQIGGKDAE